MKRFSLWFSLVELMLGILITSIIMIAGFQALASIWIGKVKLIEQTKIEQEAYFSLERLFELIKTWGTIDYEEYWNRYNYNTTYASGHFLQNSGFWNFGSNYYCLSWTGTMMGTGGCLTTFNTRSDFSNLDSDYSWSRQPYNSYKKQFIDFNGDADWDLGNEDASTSGQEDFKWDDDDVFLGMWPEAFSSTGLVSELYLINPDGTERTFFRWSVKQDPDAPAFATCNFANQQFPTGTGCLGTIQFLKLTWIDEGYDHGPYAWSPAWWLWDDDGEIDTWLIHKDFDPSYATWVLAGSGTYDYWQNIFPDTVHVSNVSFYAFPNKQLQYSWKDSNNQIQIAPYIQLKMTLQPSWKEKGKIRWLVPEVDIATTIHLLDLDFQ